MSYDPRGYGNNPNSGYGAGYGGGAGGGYNQQQQQQRPPQAPGVANDQLQYWFRAVDSTYAGITHRIDICATVIDGSGQLDAMELQRALVNGDWSQFSIETVRLMIGMFDRD
ncbi:hypothetical protein H4R99_008614, partial [Coemansia sp. RSA 1722]